MVPNEPKLSIVIPVLGTVDDLERSLISVLQCRDNATEVLLVFNRPYDDPYALEDEVRFVHAPPKSGWADCVNLAVAECRGPVVHLLSSGTVVGEGWTEAALAHFEDPRVGSVTPVVVEAGDTDIVRSAGVAYEVGGRRRVVARGEQLADLDTETLQILGPTCVAGFYRRELFADGQGFSPRVGDLLADVDWALRLERAGYKSVLEPAVQVQHDGHTAHVAGSWSSGRHAERLFRRHAVQNGWLRSLTRHALVVSAELWPRLALTTSIARLLGRASTWLSVEPAVVDLESSAVSEGPATLRFERGEHDNSSAETVHHRRSA